MAIEILHSRVATLVDNSNPDEIQADDWNDAHPITGDGMGLLFSNSAGAVAETMTVDMGTLTASTPLTLRQTWDNAAQDVTFNGVRIEVVDGIDANGDPLTSSYFDIVSSNGTTDYVTFRQQTARTKIASRLEIYEGNIDTSAIGMTISGINQRIDFGQEDVTEFWTRANSAGIRSVIYDGAGGAALDQADYNANGIAHSVASADFTLPISETALASWANVPTNTDIADGYSQCGIDTNTGDVYLAANVGGTIFKVQLV